MDYSKLSDIEINGRVLHFITNGKAISLQQASVASGETDYCNNPADAWPIIQQSRISITHHAKDFEWHCYAHGVSQNVINKNPLRAAMIVFLMMQGDE